MANRAFYPIQGSLRKQVVQLFSTIVVSTTGAISSQTGADKSGFIATRVSAKVGRYTLALVDAYTALLFANAVTTGATDAAFTTTAGSSIILRNVDIANKTLDIQFIDAATGVDRDVLDSSTFYITLTLANSSV